MKTLSRLFALVVIAVVTTVVVVGCCNLPVLPGIATYSVEIGGKQKTPTYVEWKGDGTAFYRALDQVRLHGEYCLCVMETSGATPHKIKGSKCYARYECPRPNIRTVKVTKSKAADNIAAGGSAANDPNITYRIQSPDPGDISKVLSTLETPTSAP
jgi:hypothetical protein